jgi:hypothetical protein
MVTPPTSHLSNGSEVPASPLIHPAFISEVRIEEVDLVLAVYARRIGGGALHTEMKVDYSRTDDRSSLRNKLSSTHGLAILIGGVVERDLDTLAAA